jgi:FkbM family methyltransferase
VIQKSHKEYYYSENDMDLVNRLTLALASTYLRHTPFELGAWRMVQHFLAKLRKTGASMGERVVRTRYGFKYKADLGDWLGQYVYLTGHYEPDTARIIADLLRPGDVFIDVGANSGFFTLLAAKRVGASGQVHSFEPLPVMRQRLQENLALNGFQNVTLHDVALSNARGEVTFYEGPQGHKGISSLRPISQAANTLRIQTLPMDDLLAAIPSIRLIKIDVEGAEQLVVEGMWQLLSKHRPFLILEVTDEYLKPFGHDAVGLCSLLCASGYRIFHITSNGPREISPSQAGSMASQYNALFSPEPLPASIAATAGIGAGHGAPALAITSA